MPSKHKTVQCPKCGMETRKDNLRRHIGRMHPEVPPVVPEVPPVVPEVPPVVPEVPPVVPEVPPVVPEVPPVVQEFDWNLEIQELTDFMTCAVSDGTVFCYDAKDYRNPIPGTWVCGKPKNRITVTWKYEGIPEEYYTDFPSLMPKIDKVINFRKQFLAELNKQEDFSITIVLTPKEFTACCTSVVSRNEEKFSTKYDLRGDEVTPITPEVTPVGPEVTPVGPEVTPVGPEVTPAAPEVPPMHGYHWNKPDGTYGGFIECSCDNQECSM